MKLRRGTMQPVMSLLICVCLLRVECVVRVETVHRT